MIKKLKKIGEKMKLITFQTLDALKELISKGYLETNESLINTEKYGLIYDWIIEKMTEHIPNEFNCKLPLWCWVKFKNGICPPKHKGKSKDKKVKITFHKSEHEVLITDYRRYAFVLNNVFIPSSKKEKEEFEKILRKYNVTEEDLKAAIRKDKFKTHRTDKEYLNVCKIIRQSFDKCITRDSDVLQGCIWRIDLSEVDKIEILNDTEYTYGTFNYLRANGKRFDWIDDYYKKIF